MSLASASPRRASFDPDIIHITQPPPPLPLAPCPRPHQHPYQPMPPPSTPSGALPPARSSSPRHHTHVSSNISPNTGADFTWPIGRISTPARRIPHTPSEHRAAADQAGQAAARAAAASYDVTDERIIHALMEEFASPSTYPSFTNGVFIDEDDEDDDEEDDDDDHEEEYDDDIYQDDSPIATTATTQNSDCMGGANDPTADVPDSPSQQLQAGPSANTTQNTDFSLDTQHTDLIDDQGTTETAATSFSENMPTTTRRRATAGTPPPPKRQQRGVQTEERPRRTKEIPPIVSLTDDEDIFGEAAPAAKTEERPGQMKKIPPTVSLTDDGITDEDLTTIDLTEATEVPAELKKPLVDTRIKISAFQCAICMDDVTGLTVTHCGKDLPQTSFHLFSLVTNIVISSQGIYSAQSVCTTRWTSSRQRANVPCAAPKST